MLSTLVRQAESHANKVAQRVLGLHPYKELTPTQKIAWYMEEVRNDLEGGNYKHAASSLEMASQVAAENRLSLPSEYHSLRISTGQLGFDANMERAQQIMERHSKDRPLGSRLGTSHDVDLLTVMETAGLSGAYTSALDYLNTARKFAGMAGMNNISPEFTELETRASQAGFKFQSGLAMERLSNLSPSSESAYLSCVEALSHLRQAENHAVVAHITWPEDMSALKRRLEEIVTPGANSFSQQFVDGIHPWILRLQMDVPLYTR